jgi:hypothetical protein
MLVVIELMGDVIVKLTRLESARLGAEACRIKSPRPLAWRLAKFAKPLFVVTEAVPKIV